MTGLGIAAIVVAALAAYFIGNISPSTILAKRAGHDIKKEGSGNAGTTNALRVLGKKAALITLIVDVAKGALAVILARLIVSGIAGPEAASTAAAWCGLAVFAGHIWPVIYKFQGGKGVATALGVILATDPACAGLALLVFVTVVALTRYVSLGSMLAALSFPVLELLLGRTPAIPVIIMVVILIVKHRANIQRLIAGKENKLSFSKAGK